MPDAAPPRQGTRIQLCGRLSVELDGSERVQRLRGRQVPLLLAYLVLHRGRPVGREELIGALWPGIAPRSQDAALRTLLSRLRSALGSAALQGRDELQLTLPEPVWIDLEAAADQVARAEAALAGRDAKQAWGLAQVPLNVAGRGLLPGSTADWIDRARRELEDIRLRALEVVGRAGLLLGAGQLASVERAARALLEAEPYRESGYVLLMSALQRQGNVAEGLRIFDRLRTLLRDELGTAPSPEALAAHQRLLTPEPETAAEAGRAPAGAHGRAAPGLVARAAQPLIGREAPLAEITGWLGQAGARPERVLLLAGDAGVGKTRLLAEIAGPGPRRRGDRAGRAGGRRGADPLSALPRRARALRADAERARARRARPPPWAGARPPGPRTAAPAARAGADRRRSTPRPSATGSSRPSSTCWPSCRPGPRPCSCSTTCTGPTGRR